MRVRMPRHFLCWLLVLLLFAGSTAAQPPQAEKIRQQVGKIGVLGTITVSMPRDVEYYGTVRRIGADDFSMDEIDQQREITLRYADVRKVRRGYGTTRNIYGRRIHPRTRLIVTLAVIGGLLTLVFIAVASDHS
jgi:hypothetical protein